MAKKISLTALFTAFAVVLSYIESFIPITGIPGVKIGLANFAIMLALYLLGYKEAILINIIRIIIVGAMFGNLFGILFSISGALISFCVMAISKKINKLSVITIAILGGVSHNIAQLIIAGFVVETYSVLVYIPVLIISGLITGAVIGILSEIVIKRINTVFSKVIRK